MASVVAQDFEPEQYEVVVVDSSPDDQNERLVAEFQSGSRCSVRCERKIPEGPGPSRNLGARLARGKILAFMDSDCQASPGWLRQGVAPFDDPSVGLVQGRTIPEPGVPRDTFDDFVWVEHESFIYETANIFYRREAFEQSGGFPSEQGAKLKVLGGEDIEVAWKVKRAGWQSRFVPGALVFHDVIRMPLTRWLINKRLYIFPKYARMFPELRRFFYRRYFFDRIHAQVLLALAGLALTPLTWFALILCLPYGISRASETTQRLRGPLRLVRAAMYFPKDLASVAIMAAGSVHYRTLLL